jgi:hypothetical protein
MEIKRLRAVLLIRGPRCAQARLYRSIGRGHSQVGLRVGDLRFNGIGGRIHRVPTGRGNQSGAWSPDFIRGYFHFFPTGRLLDLRILSWGYFHFFLTGRLLDLRVLSWGYFHFFPRGRLLDLRISSGDYFYFFPSGRLLSHH